MSENELALLGVKAAQEWELFCKVVTDCANGKNKHDELELHADDLINAVIAIVQKSQGKEPESLDLVHMMKQVEELHERVDRHDERIELLEEIHKGMGDLEAADPNFMLKHLRARKAKVARLNQEAGDRKDWDACNQYEATLIKLSEQIKRLEDGR